MPIWNEELKQWGYLYHEEVSSFQWLGINREGYPRMPIDKPFAYHKPGESGLAKINNLREAFSSLKKLIEEVAPASRERSVAITELETSAMWAIKAVVFNDSQSIVEP
jgi:hypothetical protein